MYVPQLPKNQIRRLPSVFEFAPGVINDSVHNGDFIGWHFLPPGRRLFKKTKKSVR